MWRNTKVFKEKKSVDQINSVKFHCLVSFIFSFLLLNKRANCVARQPHFHGHASAPPQQLTKQLNKQIFFSSFLVTLNSCVYVTTPKGKRRKQLRLLLYSRAVVVRFRCLAGRRYFPPPPIIILCTRPSYLSFLFIEVFPFFPYVPIVPKKLFFFKNLYGLNFFYLNGSRISP